MTESAGEDGQPRSAAAALARRLIRGIDEVPLERLLREPLRDARGERLTPVTAAAKLGASFDIAEPGKRTFPYPFHHAQREMCIILAGSGTLRVAGEMLPLKAGAVISIPRGPAFPHRMLDPSDAPRRPCGTGAPARWTAAALVLAASLLGTPIGAAAENDRHAATQVSSHPGAHAAMPSSGVESRPPEANPAAVPAASSSPEPQASSGVSAAAAASPAAPVLPASSAAPDAAASTAAQIAAANAAAGFPHVPPNRSWLGALPALADRVGLGKLLGHAVPDGTGSSSFVALLLIAGGGFAVIGLAMRRFAFVPKRRRAVTFAENPPEEFEDA